MTKTKLAKITATAITGTALTLGALVTFQGTETIDSGKNIIIEFAEKINLYESNETKLLSKINELKTERDELILQVSKFEGVQLDEMNEKISGLENQIVEYETQLSNVETNAETLAGRILDLEAEVILANEKSQELQTVIDENIVEAKPLTDVELFEITNEGNIDFAYAIGTKATEIRPGITISSGGRSVRVANNTGKSIKVNFYALKDNIRTISNRGSEPYYTDYLEYIVIEDSSGTVIANINIKK